MATTTNFGWTTPDDTGLVKDGASAIRTLGSAVDTSMAKLKGGTSGQVLSKATNTDMDFTWAAAGISASLVDAKGDLLAGTADNTIARLGVGSNDQVLTADSTAATGLKWATPASGGMTLLSTTTISGTSTTISGISGSYTDLLVVISNYKYASGAADVLIGFNGTPSAGNWQANLYGNASGSSSNSGRENNYIQPHSGNANDGGQDFSMALKIHRYSSSDTFKNWYYSGTFWHTNQNARRAIFGGGSFSGTSAISSLYIQANNGAAATSGTIYIYGVK